MSTAAPKLSPCPKCRADTYRTRDGDCVVCAARAAGDEVRAERKAAKTAERGRLGMAPLKRSRAIVGDAIDSALHWSTWLAKYADGDEAIRVERVQRYLTVARRELGR